MINRRKRKIINKSFQYKYSVIITTFGAFIFLLFLIPSYYLINLNYNLFIDTGLQIAPEIVETIEAERRLIIYGFLAIFSVCSIILFILSITFTHKIVGPIYALERSISNLIKGKLSEKMTLRHSDDLQELETIYNKIKEHIIKKDRELVDLVKLARKEPNSSELEKIIKEKETDIKNSGL